jgi:hypothetical protein
MLLERASPDPGRHHPDHPGPMLGLVAVIVLGLVVLLLRRWPSTDLPLIVDYALTAACIAGGVLTAKIESFAFDANKGKLYAAILNDCVRCSHVRWLFFSCRSTNSPATKHPKP